MFLAYWLAMRLVCLSLAFTSRIGNNALSRLDLDRMCVKISQPRVAWQENFD
jgi:hypothetical protein